MLAVWFGEVGFGVDTLYLSAWTLTILLGPSNVIPFGVCASCLLGHLDHIGRSGVAQMGRTSSPRTVCRVEGSRMVARAGQIHLRMVQIPH